MNFELQDTRYEDPKNFFRHSFRYALAGEISDADKLGFQAFFTLEKAGYTIIPIVKGERIALGVQTASSLEQIISPPDAVILMVGEKEGIEIIEQMKNRGIFRVWVQKGFSSNIFRDLCRSYNMEGYFDYSLFEVLQDIQRSI
jgi:predicted CoA-binding protein